MGKNDLHLCNSIENRCQSDNFYVCFSFKVSTLTLVLLNCLFFLGGLKETKLFLPHPRVKVSIVGSLRDREVACSASDRQGSSFESCVWRTVSSQSSHHPQEVLLAQFSLYVHKGGLKPDSFHFIFAELFVCIFHSFEAGIADAISNFK